MFIKQEYDFAVGLRNHATVAGLTLAALLLAAPAFAQNPTVHGTPPSVTSLGFGGTGNRPHGLPPSVTSLGFGQQRFGAAPPPQHIQHRHEHPIYGGGYYYPYAYGYADDSAQSAAPDQDPYQDPYAGGPTIFDRRGPGTNYAPPAAPPPSQEVAAAPAPEPAPALPDTVLIFKDGHQAEIANYAIVGSTLYDLSGGQRHKIALADLDLAATVKQNDDRGLDFNLPTTAEAN